MLETFLNIGRKLREDGDEVQFLPFVEFGEKEARISSDNKVLREKPFVQVYDVFIKGREWEIKKSEEPFDENTNVTFIKGDNNDRFYIAGDVNGNYFGKSVKLKKYFKDIEDRIKQSIPPEFIKSFRFALNEHLDEIETLVQTFNQNSKKQSIYIQFRFHKNNEIFYWEDMLDEVRKMGNFIFDFKYVELKSNEYLASRVPVAFFTNYNLNTLPNLNKGSSYKILDIRNNPDKLKSLIVADKYLAGKEERFGRAVIQVLPSGNGYSKESLLNFLKYSATKRSAGQMVSDDDEYTDPVDWSFESFNREKSIDKYDVLFLNKGANTTDVITYISSINKTDIEDIKISWKEARESTLRYYMESFQPQITSSKVNEISINYLQRVLPFTALSSLLKGFGKEDKKLEKHHRQVLYKIFRKQYYKDPQLLSGLIKKTEYGIRNNENFRLKFFNLFLNYLYLNNLLVNNQFIMMQKTQSYQAGQLLGELARSLDQVINSFSKQYAGNISRRIASKEDFQKLFNFIQEKLVMHEKLYANVREKATELNELLAGFDENYKRDYAVAGFFYSYMMPFHKGIKNKEEN